MSVYSDVSEKIINDSFKLFFNSEISETYFKQMVDLTTDHLEEHRSLPPYKKAKDLFDKIIKIGKVTSKEMIQVHCAILLFRFLIK